MGFSRHSIILIQGDSAGDLFDSIYSLSCRFPQLSSVDSELEADLHKMVSRVLLKIAASWGNLTTNYSVEILDNTSVAHSALASVDLILSKIPKAQTSFISASMVGLLAIRFPCKSDFRGSLVPRNAKGAVRAILRSIEDEARDANEDGALIGLVINQTLGPTIYGNEIRDVAIDELVAGIKEVGGV